jgi:sigma-B regulation protein RsbU (phosphoserine phosphatase)
VIFISALDEIQDKVEAFNVGGLDYITKPFQLEEVLARVRTHLELRELQKQLQEKNKRMEMELALAGEVQRSFLPVGVPETPGWQMSFTLLPARNASGDFYDVFRLPDDRIGLVTADVVDKGIGAALFMALCYALLKTSVMDHPSQPEKVFKTVNQRILEYTTANQFLTIFYGVLDLKSGQMVYCNAGHCPPLLLGGSNPSQARELKRTGLPLGIYKDKTWGRGTEMINPGDILVVYTDGITEADNQKGEFFGEERLKKSVFDLHTLGSKKILDGILECVKTYTVDMPQYDDITLAVVKRNPHEN